MKERLMKLHSILALALACLTATLHAQTPTIKVESHIVLLDMSVTDAKGNPVLDLRPEEFRITEKKVPQKILSFEPPSAHFLPPESQGKLLVNSTADLVKIGQRPVTLLVLDELNMNFAEESYARTKLIEWLKRQPEILPQPTALLAITYKDFHLLRDFTQDRNALLDIMSNHHAAVLGHEDTPRTGPQASQNMFATLGALEQIAQVTRGIPGRKNVLWIGDGFPTVAFGDISRTSADEIDASLRRLSGVLLHSRVTLSVIGSSLVAVKPTTIETQGDYDIASNGNFDQILQGNGKLQFANLAPPTGGHAYGNHNDLDAEIGHSVAEGQTYYTLSYHPSNPSNNPREYRSIHVEVTRPGLTVQTRDGYYEEPPTPAEPSKVSTQQLAFDLFGAALSTLPYPDFHIIAQRNGPTDFTLHASARDITWRDLPDGRRHSDLVLLAACLSPHQKLLAKNFATLGSNTEATLASLGIATAPLHMHFDVPPGTTHIRFVIRDMQSGRVGTADLSL
jgi:VWFA-related protein